MNIIRKLIWKIRIKYNMILYRMNMKKHDKVHQQTYIYEQDD